MSLSAVQSYRETFLPAAQYPRVWSFSPVTLARCASSLIQPCTST